MKIISWLLAICLVGCGDSGGYSANPSTPASAAAQPQSGPVYPTPPVVSTGPIVFVGDSITQFWDWGGFIVPNPTLSVLISGEVNDGISGDRTDAMLARFDAVLAQHPGVVVILGGTNDLRQLENPTVDNIATMAEEATAAGARVILGTVPPADVSLYPTSDAPTEAVNMARIQTFNVQLRALAAAYGYVVVDYYSVMVNPDGTQNQGLFVPADLIHPNVAGYHIMWTMLKPALAPYL